MAGFATDPIPFAELQRHLTDSALRPPAIVQRVNPAQDLQSNPFRELSHDAMLREVLSGIGTSAELLLGKKGAILPIGEAVTTKAAEALRAELRKITGGAESLSDRDLMRLLSKVTPEQRVEFIQNILKYAQMGESAHEFLRGKLNNVLLSTTETERAVLAAGCASKLDSPVAADFVLEICRSARSFEELCALVRCVGVERLVGSGNQSLLELAATATLLQELQALAAPHLKDPSGELTEQIDDLESMLGELQAHLVTHPELKDTQRYRHLLEQLNHDSAWLAREADSGKDLVEIGVALETFRERMRVQLQFGILLRGQEAGIQQGIGLDDGPLPSHGVEWTLAQVRSAEATFRTLPGVILYTTPMLYEVQRVETLGSPYILGRRFEDGVVRIANSAINLKALETLYPGTTSLQVVLTHELGHSVQLGLYPGAFEFIPGEGASFSDGDPRYEFKEYLGLAGWRIFAPGQFKVTNSGLSVQIGEDEYPVGQPVKFNDQDVIFTLRGGLLLAHKALGPFSLVDYARTNPWEDFAEAFCEYILLPERLIVFAPEKFKFLDEEFGRYREDTELYKKLERQLDRRKQQEQGR